MNISEDSEKLEYLKDELFDRYRYIQSLDQSRRNQHDVAFLENFQAAIRLWGWNWLDGIKHSKK
ncbi:MAG TPA: hypothetical protein V6C85_03970 [Allocoleopsis sp.]